VSVLRRAAAAVPLALLLAAPASPAAPAATSLVWMQNAWTVHKLNQSYPATASAYFGRPGSYGTGSAATADPVLDGFAATPVLRYTSYAQFSSDVSAGVIPDATWPPGSWVEYDIEAWSATPVAEQQDPERFMQMFGELAHSSGLRVVMTPARDLGNTDTTCVKSGTNNDWYVTCGIAQIAATYADGLVVQDQANTLDLAAYDGLYDTAAAQAAAANPFCWVATELSDNYGTPAQAVAAFESLTSPQGSFLNVANPDVGWENQVLTSLQAAGY
jgi:hypothetical protein